MSRSRLLHGTVIRVVLYRGRRCRFVGGVVSPAPKGAVAKILLVGGRMVRIKDGDAWDIVHHPQRDGPSDEDNF